MKRCKANIKIALVSVAAALVAAVSVVLPNGAVGRAEGAESYATKRTFALIGENVTLFSADETGARKAITTLPEGYFVNLCGEPDENGFVSAVYSDITGVVAAAGVERVDYEPRYKYASESRLAVANDGFGINVRSSPDHEADNVIAQLKERDDVYFYGTVEGKAQVPALGKTWYYVRFSYGGTQVRGYVYSLYVTGAFVPDNVIEPVPEPEPPAAETVAPSAPDGDYGTDDGQSAAAADFVPDTPQEIIMIAALSLPVPIIAYLLFRSPKKRGDPPQ